MARAPRSLLPLLLLGALVGALPANPGEAARGVLRGPMVQLTTRGSAVLTWRTTGATIPLVRYGSDPGNLERVVLPVQMTVRVSPDLAAPPDLPRLHSAPPDTYQYEAHLSGLTEDTAYYYGIFDGDELLAGCTENHFVKTLPPPDTERPLRFWVTGDTGKGSAMQRASFEGMRGYVANDGRPLDAYLHLGDMAYQNGRDPEFQANFFDIYAGLIRNTVVWPTMGNHEGHTSNGHLGIGPYYDSYVLPRNGEAGGVPSGTEAYYSFNLGPIHFVCLNSYDVDRSQAAAMGSWLQEDLVQNESEWLIAFWHHPPYSKGTHNSDNEDELVEMREEMLPLLEAHGVDLILSGHSHVYERSMLIDGAYETPTFSSGVVLDDGDGRPNGDGPYLKGAQRHPHGGTVAVVAGNGAEARNFGKSPVMRVTLPEVGSVLLDLDGDILMVSMLNRFGAVRDQFQLIKRGEIPVRDPLLDPWHPEGPAIVSADREDGKTELHIIPRPWTDDTVIRYTLNGQSPTGESAIYSGPLILEKATTVKAFTIWRGGQRTSPVSTRELSVPQPSKFRALRLPIVCGADDAVEDSLGAVTLDGNTVGIDSENQISWFGLRYPNIPIPPRATILSARILFLSAGGGIETARWTIRGDLSDSSVPFQAVMNGLSQRLRTNSSVDWEPAEWLLFGVRGSDRQTPELSELVEEITSAPMWERGNALGFLITGSGVRRATSLEGFAQFAPELTIVYDERPPLAIASEITPVVEVESGEGGSMKIYVAYPALLSALRFGLSYSMEGSPDLTPGSWETLTTVLDQPLPGASPYWTLKRYLVALPAGVDARGPYFLRVRVESQ